MTRDELVLPAGFHTFDQFNAIKIRNYFETYRLLAFYLAALDQVQSIDYTNALLLVPNCQSFIDLAFGIYAR
jgi:hypothetical protein